MRDWIFKPNRRNRLVDWWAVDSWLDSSVYGAWARYKDWYATYSNFFARFRVSGFRKAVTEAVSEGTNLAVLVLLALLTFALPAIEETKNTAWRSANDFSVTFLDRYGNEIGKRGILHSDAVPLEEIPDVLIKATLATEDRRFFEHFGIDIIGTFRAALANIQNRDVVQGGSSLTQQLAKNLFLSSERSFDRKIKEAFIALWLEQQLTKREILKMYLDRSYLGGGTFGVEAASQFYFGKSVRDINLQEAALLAGLFKAPTKFAPHANPAESRARANQVLTNMVDAGFMTEGQVHAARLNPARVIDRMDLDAPNYFLDWAFEEVQRLMKGKGEYMLVAQTTLDPSLQKLAEQSVATILDQNSRTSRVGQAALVSMEASDGAVRAMVGGRDYGESQFNRATKALRQPGSSFKSYVYLTALENGYTPNSIEIDGPVSCGNWSPENYSGGFRGRMTLTQALALSINTIAVKLSLKVGREKVIETLKKVGINNVQRSCSMALGDQGITVLDHTAGYAVFANGGKAVRPYAIIEIRNQRDEVVYSHDLNEPKPKQVFERNVIEQMNQMQEQVVLAGTGRAAQLDFTHVAGKTGTSSSYRDAWFIGYTGQYVTGVWFGNDSFSPMNRVTGGSLPAQTWKLYNVGAHVSMNIPQIPGLPVHPRQLEEQQRLSEIRRDDPTFGTVAEALQGMPARTKKILENLNKVFRETPKLDETDTPTSRGAMIAPSAAGRIQ